MKTATQSQGNATQQHHLLRECCPSQSQAAPSPAPAGPVSQAGDAGGPGGRPKRNGAAAAAAAAGGRALPTGRFRRAKKKKKEKKQENFFRRFFWRCACGRRGLAPRPFLFPRRVANSGGRDYVRRRYQQPTSASAGASVSVTFYPVL